MLHPDPIFKSIYAGDSDNIEIEIWKSKVPSYNRIINVLALGFSIKNKSSERVFSEYDDLLRKTFGSYTEWS